MSFSFQVYGYRAARFGFGTVVDQSYPQEYLGEYLAVFDWVSGTVKGTQFWEGDHPGYHPMGIPSANGTQFINSSHTRELAKLDPVTGKLTVSHYSRYGNMWPAITGDGYILIEPTGRFVKDNISYNPMLLYDTVTDQQVDGYWEIASTKGGGTPHFSGVGTDSANRFWITTDQDFPSINRLHRFDPRTKALDLVYEAPRTAGGTFHWVGSTGNYGVVAETAPKSAAKGARSTAHLMVVDLSSLTIVRTTELDLEPTALITWGFESKGVLYFLVTTDNEEAHPELQALWTIDPATGTAVDTGGRFDFGITDQVFVRDDQLVAFAQLFANNQIYGIRYDLTNKTEVARYNIPVSAMVHP